MEYRGLQINCPEEKPTHAGLYEVPDLYGEYVSLESAKAAIDEVYADWEVCREEGESFSEYLSMLTCAFYS